MKGSDLKTLVGLESTVENSLKKKKKKPKNQTIQKKKEPP